ncbi:hypothetical protein KHS38_21915 [Mucilaginibacter sp. Bleaf8]|uniref:MAC/perforin domain-containing protein n=1 Tax=Mucilaginibacter sp. Bleaf8 TaxID=2834430 RepID=UPI001BCFF7AA|nr:MAC/perforin domain-containing protein [Mucilaginibacter sp. Bleaf8]MBS7567077.1 hypothetical protein [Mucilaginibacter sp. Bleaf8]
MKKQTKVALVLWVLTAALAGCKKDEKITTTNPSPPVSKKVQLSAGDGKWDLLGYGLDVTGDLLDLSTVSDAPIIDMEKFEKDYLSRLNVGTTINGSSRFFAGLSAKDYTKEVSKTMSLEAGVNPRPKIEGAEKNPFQANFSASINRNSSDGNTYMYSSRYSYATYESLVQVKRLRFTEDASIDLLYKYLTPEFLDNVRTKSAEELVQRYGTHIMLDISIGGRLRFNYSGFIENESNTTKKTSTLKAGLGIPIFKALNVNITGSLTKEEMTKLATETRNKEYTVKFYGGTNSGRSVAFDHNGNTSETLNIASWEQSVNASNAALIDVGKAVYLYNFIADPVKKAQVKAAVEKHIADSQIKELGEAPVHVFYNQRANVWRYEFNPENLSYLHDGNWVDKGVYFYAMKEQVPGSVPIYEYYAPTTSDCTWGQGRETNSYWQGGGIKFYAFPTAQPGATPVYRYYHHASGRSHFLGTDPSRPTPPDQWTVEGVCFYAP